MEQQSHQNRILAKNRIVQSDMIQKRESLKRSDSKESN